MWFDEVLSVKISSMQIGQIWQELSGYTNSPPLYLWLLHFFLKIGVNEFWARLPSAIFGILTLFLIYHIGRELFKKTSAFFTLCLFVLSPLHIYYSQEARMYALWTFLITLSYFFFYKLCKGSSGFSLWTGYFLSILLSIYTHYFTAFHVLAQGIIIGIIFLFTLQKKKVHWVYFPVLWGAFALFSIPAIQLASQGSSHGSGLPLQDWTLLLLLENIIRGWLVLLMLGGGNSYYKGYHFALAFFLFLSFYAGLYFTMRRDKKLAWFCLAWLFIPLYSGTFFLEQVASYHERYFLPVTVPYLLLAGKGVQAMAIGLASLLQKIRRRLKTLLFFSRVRAPEIFNRVLPSIILIFLFVSPIKEYYGIEKQDNQSAFNYVLAHFLPGDSIVIDGFGEVAMAYYFQDLDSSIVKPVSEPAIDILGKSCRRVWYLYVWESSGVWLRRNLFQWSEKVATPQEIVPGAFPIHIMLAGVGANEVDGLLFDSQKMFSQNPGDEHSRLAYGNCLLTLGRWQDAIAVYEALASQLQNDGKGGNQYPQRQNILTQVYLGMGDTYARQGNREQAACAYQKAAAVDPGKLTDREDIDTIRKLESGLVCP